MPRSYRCDLTSTATIAFRPANLLVVKLLVPAYKVGGDGSRQILRRARKENPAATGRAGYSQEDMISHGFSARHWQQIEKGRPITLKTLLRICEVFRTPMARLVGGLDSHIQARSGVHK